MSVASFKLLKCTGADVCREYWATDGHVSFLSADTSSVDIATYPISVPSDNDSAPNRSYEMWLRWELLTLPDNYITNMKVYGSTLQPDTPLNRVQIMAGTSRSVDTPVNSTSSYANKAQHLNYYSPAAACNIYAATATDGHLKTVGDKTWYLVVQLRVDTVASQAGSNVLPFNFSYEEV